MDKSWTSDVIKIIQGIVLPLELKMNSLINLVQSLETKIDQAQAEKTKMQQIAQAGTSHSANDHQRTTGERKSEKLPTSPTKQRVQTSKRVMTRRRAREMTTRDEDFAERDHRAEPIEVLEPPAPRPRIASTSSRQLSVPQGGTENVAVPLTEQYEDAVSVHEPLEQWTTVKKRKQRRPVIRGTGDIDSDLAAIEKTRTIHVWSLRYDTTAEKLQTYMVKKRPSEIPYNVEKLQLKHTYYASFVVSVPDSAFQFFMTAENWPPNTQINEWFRKKALYKSAL